MWAWVASIFLISSQWACCTTFHVTQILWHANLKGKNFAEASIKHQANNKTVISFSALFFSLVNSSNSPFYAFLLWHALEMIQLGEWLYFWSCSFSISRVLVISLCVLENFSEFCSFDRGLEFEWQPNGWFFPWLNHLKIFIRLLKSARWNHRVILRKIKGNRNYREWEIIYPLKE